MSARAEKGAAEASGTRGWLIAAGISGAAAVALGALAAHGGPEAPDRAQFLATAQRFHLWHSLALALVAALGWNGGPRALGWAGWAFLAGLVLFSGGLYLRAFSGIDLGPLVPVGGTAFILGWLLLSLAGWQGLREGRRDPS